MIRKIFIHGWGTDKRVWGKLTDGSAVNLPSHGGKGEWDEPTYGPGVREVVSSIPDGERVIAIGWSLGANILLQAAAEYANKFRALVLVGGTPCFTIQEDFPWAQKKALVKRMIMDMRKNPKETLARFYGLNFTKEENESAGAKEFLSLYAQPEKSFDFDGITTALQALMQADLREALSSINIPCLIIHGTRDSVVPIEAARYMVANMPSSTLKKFEQAGHAPFITEPERFTGTVAEFIEKI